MSYPGDGGLCVVVIPSEFFSSHPAWCCHFGVFVGPRRYLGNVFLPYYYEINIASNLFLVLCGLSSTIISNQMGTRSSAGVPTLLNA